MVDSPIRRKFALGSLGGGTRGAEGGAEVGALPLPLGYALDASDPDVLLVLREDGTVAAAFSARGATAEGILEAAEQDTRRANRLADRFGRDTPSARNGRGLDLAD